MIRTPLKSASKGVRTAARTPGTPGVPKVREENIFVTVRVRPLSRREQATNDQVAWECTAEHTILSKNLNSERSMVPYSLGLLNVMSSCLLCLKVVNSEC
ncbi:hypothetical protein MKW98_028632 [Papaver atlanticum]|uniref:Kinesin motor domain-containing protein n=1 Tax=Papaver atlanticum TaxID=357466 RepID=A0AAD4SBD5_9MAGN|nr:hypothetical protein MKW98_028632 [Papaver atlanticum]